MGLTNFEDNIKEKLEARKIEPSIESWKKFERKLEIENNKSNSKYTWKYGLVAACLIGLVFVSAFVFEVSNEPVLRPTIVDTEIIEAIENTKNVVDTKPRKEETSISPIEPEIQKNRVAQEKKNNSVPKSTLDLKLDEINKETNQGTNEVVVNNEAEKRDGSKAEMIHSTIESQKVNEVVAKIQELQGSDASVSDAEIEALLFAAQKEIINQKTYDESTKTVDANLLLQDIETELDISLRERVLTALKSGYEEVKTAVVERNN